jgi:hypothetical protein
MPGEGFASNGNRYVIFRFRRSTISGLWHIFGAVKMFNKLSSNLKIHFMKTKLPFGLKENSFVAVVAIGLLSVIFLINFIAFFG